MVTVEGLVRPRLGPQDPPRLLQPDASLMEGAPCPGSLLAQKAEEKVFGPDELVAEGVGLSMAHCIARLVAAENGISRAIGTLKPAPLSSRLSTRTNQRSPSSAGRMRSIPSPDANRTTASGEARRSPPSRSSVLISSPSRSEVLARAKNNDRRAASVKLSNKMVAYGRERGPGADSPFHAAVTANG